MRLTKANTSITDGYLDLLENLNTSAKLDLISKLSASVKTDILQKKTSFKKAFGAFQSKETADEIINNIKSSRTLSRQIEKF